MPGMPRALALRTARWRQPCLCAGGCKLAKSQARAERAARQSR